MEVSLISVDNPVVAHGLRSISGFLKKNGVKTKLIFLPLGLDYKKEYPLSALVELTKITSSSDVIGITSMTLCLPRAVQIIKFLREKFPSKQVVFGGVHATMAPEECMNFANYVCRGEGETTLLDLVGNLIRTDIKNLWIKKNGETIRNPIRNLNENLDDYGLPDYDLDAHYIYEGGAIVKFEERHLKGEYLIHTTRGCPHMCAYCVAAALKKLYLGKGKIMRKRSVENVLEELRNMKRKFKTIKHVFITDDTFFYRDLNEIKEFCKKYGQEIGLPFTCYVSPLTLTEEKLKLLIAAGVDTVTMGIQTGSEEINAKLYKRFIPNKIVLKAADILKKYRRQITIDYQIIITNPYEKRNDLLETLKLIKKLPKPFLLETFNLAFLHGTELYEKAKKDGVIRREEDAATHLHFYDIRNHLKVKKIKERYLNSLLYLINGKNTRFRYGFIPAMLFNLLICEPVIRINEFFIYPTLLANYLKMKIINILNPLRDS